MAEMKDKVVIPAPAEKARTGGRVRLRNCDYNLTGSINMEGKKPLRYCLVPNTWVEVPEEVYDMLKRKFAEPRYTSVPDSLPGSDGFTYNAPSGSTRREQQQQYVIEFN